MESEETGAHSVRESNGASILFKHCKPQASMERTNEPKLEREKKQHPILFILERERESDIILCALRLKKKDRVLGLETREGIIEKKARGNKEKRNGIYGTEY
jgi:hypothetical protein